MRKPLAYYRERGTVAARLTRLDEVTAADAVTRTAGEFVAQEDDEDRLAAERAYDEGYCTECNRIDAAIAAADGREHPDVGKPVRSLRCACCGARTLGRQHHNQDTGWGLCPSCVGRVAAHSDDFEADHGVKGVHFALPNVA